MLFYFSWGVAPTWIVKGRWPKENGSLPVRFSGILISLFFAQIFLDTTVNFHQKSRVDASAFYKYTCVYFSGRKALCEEYFPSSIQNSLAISKK
jgi:hypothetical protein